MRKVILIIICLPILLSVYSAKTVFAIDCNRCSTSNGCERVQFINQTNQCNIPDDSVGITRTIDCSCSQISGGNNSRCTTCTQCPSRCSTYYDYCHVDQYNSHDQCQTGDGNPNYTVDCACPVVGNPNCPGGNTYKCVSRPAPSPPLKFLKGIEAVYENWCWARHDEVPRTWNGETVTDDDIKYAKDQGLDFLIVHINGPVGWYNIAKQNPNQNGHSPEEWNNPYYNFGPLDTAVQKITNAGITPVLNIWGTPQWATKWASYPPGSFDNDPPWQPIPNYQDCFDWGDYANFPPTDLSQFGHFMKAVTERYSGRHGFPKVDNYSLGNEPDLTEWNGVGGDMKDFVTMSNFAYDMVKQSNPQAVVWGPNLVSDDLKISPILFIRQLADLGYKTDKIGIHAYPLDWNKSPAEQPAQPNDFTMIDVNKFLDTLNQIPAYKNLPVIITESGYALNYFSSGSTADREKRQAEYLLQNLNYAKAYFPRIEGWTNFFLYYAPTWDTSFLGCKAVQPDTPTCYHCCDKTNGYNSYYKRQAFYTFRDFGSVITPLPGDLNHDGKVDIFDYNLLIQNFGRTRAQGFLPSTIDPDIVRNDVVDIFDYNILIENFGSPR